MEETITSEVPQEHGVHINKILSGSFAWMALGLGVSLLSAIAVLLIPGLLYVILGSDWGFFACIIVELGVVFYLSRRISTMSVLSARFFFIAYSILSGLTLSVMFFAYELISILSIFLATAILFGILSIYGARTKKDLSSYGRMAIFALIGLIIVSVINLFIGSTMLDMILSWIGVIVFTVLTAYDVQKIKNLVGHVTQQDEIKKAKIIGALTLYLDFINLFLSLLRIFGRRR